MDGDHSGHDHGMPPSNTPKMGGASGSNDQHKAIAIIGYIIPILFFIPLISDAKNNPYAKFHANQQLTLLIFWIIANFVNIVPILGQIAWLILSILGIILVIMGVINAAQGTMKPLPIIGKFTLIK